MALEPVLCVWEATSTAALRKGALRKVRRKLSHAADVLLLGLCTWELTPETEV